LWPVDKVGHFVSGMARTTKEAFTSQLTGVPLTRPLMDRPMLLIYNSKEFAESLATRAPTKFRSFRGRRHEGIVII
jgi:hypothetical protein